MLYVVNAAITPGNKRAMEALEEKYISGVYDPFNAAAGDADGVSDVVQATRAKKRSAGRAGQ